MATLVEALVDDLDGDLANRRRELADLRLMVSSSTGARQNMLARSCHVMAYAHWEGFVKKALRSYIKYLVRLHIPLGELQYGLQGLALRSSIRAAVEPERSVADLASLLADLDNLTARTFVVDAQDVVRTGNMTADTLRTLLSCVGLEYLSTYETRENYINSVLCGRRHRIAHGEWQPISAAEARDVASDVLDLCDELNQQVQTAALYAEYRR